MRNVLQLSSTNKRNRHVIINDPEIWSLVDPALIISEIAENDEEKAKEIVKRILRVPRVILESFQSLSLLSTTLPTSHSLALILMIPNLQKLFITLKKNERMFRRRKRKRD